MTDSTLQTGPSSIATLAADNPSFDDGPWTVHGIALGEGDITVGVSGQRVEWPRAALQDAAAQLAGKKLTDGRNHDDLEAAQPPTKAIVGEVTAARYSEGVGIVYQAEVDDPDIAQLIQRDRVDVSPVVAFDAREAEDGEGLVAESIQGFRDLAVVAEGAAPSNEITPGPAPVATAAAAGLSAAFSDADGAGSAGDSDDPTGASSSGSDADPSDDRGTSMTDDDLTDKQRELLAAARQRDDPVVLEAAQRDKLDAHDELIAAAEGFSEPTVVDESEYEALQARTEDLEALMDDRLTEDKGLKQATVEAMSFEAKVSEFENADGEFTAEALVQTPETGDVGGDDTPPSTDDPEVEALIEDLDADDRDDAVELLQGRYDHYQQAGWESNAAQTADRLETLGVEVN